MRYWKMYKDNEGVWCQTTMHEVRKMMVRYCYDQRRARDEFQAQGIFDTPLAIYKRSEKKPEGE